MVVSLTNVTRTARATKVKEKIHTLKRYSQILCYIVLSACYFLQRELQNFIFFNALLSSFGVSLHTLFHC